MGVCDPREPRCPSALTGGAPPPHGLCLWRTRTEFRRHRNAKPEFLTGFFTEWQGYADMLTAQPAGTPDVGRDLTPDHLAAMTDEQKVRGPCQAPCCAQSFVSVGLGARFGGRAR